LLTLGLVLLLTLKCEGRGWSIEALTLKSNYARHSIGIIILSLSVLMFSSTEELLQSYRWSFSPIIY